MARTQGRGTAFSAVLEGVEVSRAGEVVAEWCVCVQVWGSRYGQSSWCCFGNCSEDSVSCGLGRSEGQRRFLCRDFSGGTFFFFPFVRSCKLRQVWSQVCTQRLEDGFSRSTAMLHRT